MEEIIAETVHEMLCMDSVSQLVSDYEIDNVVSAFKSELERQMKEYYQNA